MSRKAHQDGQPAVSSVVEALIYTRVSSDEQEREGLSLPAQLAACRRYASDKGWAIGEEYQDVLTGKRDDRPHYQRLLGDVRRLRAEGRAVVVVVAWLHRFGRRVLERVRSREELKALGVPLHTVKEGGEVSDLVANILASVAEEEVRQLGERVSEVIQHAADKGWHPVGRPAWGYCLRPATDGERRQGSPLSALERDPDQAPKVVEALTRFAGGEALRSIGRWASALPEVNRGTFTRLDRDGNEITVSRSLGDRALRLLFSSAVYIGRHGHGPSFRLKVSPTKILTGSPAETILAQPVGCWPALIEDDLWRRVQERLETNRRVPRQASGNYLLTGFLRCPSCGSRMVGHRRTTAYPRYVCISRVLGAAAPAQKCIATASVRQVDAAVCAALGRVVDLLTATEPRLQAALRQAWRELRQPSHTADVALQIKRVEQEQARARKRLADAAIKLVDGDLDKAGYDAARQRVERDLKAAEAEHKRLAKTSASRIEDLPSFDEALAAVGSWSAALAHADTTRRREALTPFVERAVPRRIGHNRYTVDITPTTLGQGLFLAADTVQAQAA